MLRVIGNKKYKRIPIRGHECTGCSFLLKSNDKCVLGIAKEQPMCIEVAPIYEDSKHYIYREN